MQWNDTAIERFRQKIRVDGECWRWTGAHTRSYGTIGLKPYHRTVYAHRFAYEYFVGPIPDGLEVDHVVTRGCRFRDCVNPAHLEVVDRRTNVLRSENFAAKQARRTHCPANHAYDKVSISASGRRRRRCSTCAREQSRAWYQRRTASSLACPAC